MLWNFLCIMLTLGALNGLEVNPIPGTIIRDKASELDRPEGVTFSPTGKYVAVANALVDKITFYKRVGENGYVYEKTPAFTIEGKESELNYPHDISYSPDGQYLAVANRVGNSITIYSKDEDDDHFTNKPIAIIQGTNSELFGPDSVRYSPIENIIVVANIGNHFLTFYRYQDNVYENIPYQVIKGPPEIILVPDSVDFSSDGELLAVTSHDTDAVVLYQKIPGKEGEYSSQPVEVIKGPDTHFKYPHSVSFHPSNNYLLVSSSQGKQNINIFEKVSDTFPRYQPKPVVSLEVLEMYEPCTIHLLGELHQDGGCKGVAFSPDGASLAITQNLCADQLKLPYSVGVLLIYPVTGGW